MCSAAATEQSFAKNMMLSDAGLVLALEFEAAGLKDSVLDTDFQKI